MKHTVYHNVLKTAVGLSFLLMACTSFQRPAEKSWHVQALQGAPAGENGIEQGVSACFAGFYHEHLIIAGGCNFPDIPAVEGGKKRYYQGVYVAALPKTDTLVWKQVGLLSAPVAYGASIITSDGLVCVGGCNESGAVRNVFRLSYKQDVWSIDSLPSLPCTLDNMSGAYLNHHLYVAGGYVNGMPSNALYALDLNRAEEGWKRLADFPGYPRVQPVLVAQQDCLYLWGGFAGATVMHPASLSVDGYCYHPQTDTWISVATPIGRDGVDVSLGGGSGIALHDSLILCTGGVNKTIFLAALKREAMLKQAVLEGNTVMVDSLIQAGNNYMSLAAEAYQFNDRLLLYNTKQDVWNEVFRTAATARAGAILVGADSVFFNIHGELKPGIRTTDITKILYHSSMTSLE